MQAAKSYLYYNFDNKTATVRILLEHGADVNTMDQEGKLHNCHINYT